MLWLTSGQVSKASVVKFLHVPVQNVAVAVPSLNALTQVIFSFSAFKAAVQSGPDEHAVSYAEIISSAFGSPYEKVISR